MNMETENVKHYDEMSDWQRQSAIHSARYILEDMSMEDIHRATGLPMGVIAAAFDNIFVSKDAVDERDNSRDKMSRPVRLRNKN